MTLIGGSSFWCSLELVAGWALDWPKATASCTWCHSINSLHFGSIGDFTEWCCSLSAAGSQGSRYCLACRIAFSSNYSYLVVLLAEKARSPTAFIGITTGACLNWLALIGSSRRSNVASGTVVLLRSCPGATIAVNELRYFATAAALNSYFSHRLFFWAFAPVVYSGLQCSTSSSRSLTEAAEKRWLASRTFKAPACGSPAPIVFRCVKQVADFLTRLSLEIAAINLVEAKFVELRAN